MTNETTGTGFTVSRVEWEYSTSRALKGTGDPNPRPPQRTGIGAIHVRCNTCSYEWRALKARRPTPGSFLGHHLSELDVSCPECGQVAKIPKAELPGI